MPQSRTLLLVLVALWGVARWNVASGEPLQLRFTWAPIFCFAGSSNGVPEEFCGESTGDSVPRFQRHRQSILRPLNSKSCSTSIPAYNPSAISDAVRKHWQCTNPSYTPSNADGWYERVWDMGLGCAAQKLGMTQTEAFEYMTSLWDRYKPDAALMKSRTYLWTKGKMSKKAYLKRLKKAYGVEPYVTCGGGRDTRSSLSTVSVCIESATREIAACPEAVLKANAKRCPKKLVIERGNGSVKSVSQECRAYY